MQRNSGDMIIYSSTYASFESTATVEPQQRISYIYIYLYVSDQSVFIGSELGTNIDVHYRRLQMMTSQALTTAGSGTELLKRLLGCSINLRLNQLQG